MPKTTAPNQGCFKPGQSGNPAGRPKGARHHTTLAVEALLDGEGEVIVRKAIEAAKAGDMVAIRLVLDRICPPRKTRPIHIELPPMHDAGGVAEAQQEVLRAACAGELLLDEAQALSGLLEARRQSLETQELEARLSELEGAPMPRMASNSLRRRITRLQFARAKADDGRAGPSSTLLELLTKLQGMSKEQLLEVRARRVGLGG